MSKQLEKMWKVFLIEIGKSETEVAKENGYFPQNLNRRIKQGTMKYTELAEIVERYGYSIRIHKEGDREQ